MQELKEYCDYLFSVCPDAEENLRKEFNKNLDTLFELGKRGDYLKSRLMEIHGTCKTPGNLMEAMMRATILLQWKSLVQGLVEHDMFIKSKEEVEITFEQLKEQLEEVMEERVGECTCPDKEEVGH